MFIWSIFGRGGVDGTLIVTKRVRALVPDETNA